MNITKKQNKYIDYFIETGNMTEAARLAGYKAKNLAAVGSENYRKLEPYIRDRLSAKDAARIASQDEVLKYLTRIMRGEDLEEVVVVEGTGDGCSEARTIDKALNQKDRIKAAELLGKRYGIFTDKMQLEHKANSGKLDEILKQLIDD